MASGCDQCVWPVGVVKKCKRNVRMKTVASGCDQCVWPVGVVAGCGHWVGH